MRDVFVYIHNLTVDFIVLILVNDSVIIWGWPAGMIILLIERCRPNYRWVNSEQLF